MLRDFPGTLFSPKVTSCNWEYIDLVRIHGYRVAGLTAVPGHFHEKKVVKSRVTGCLERTIRYSAT